MTTTLDEFLADLRVWARDGDDGWYEMVLNKCADEIERLRRERDEARAKALEEAAVFVETHSYTVTSGTKETYAMEPTHEKWRGFDMQQKTVAAAIRALKDRAP